MKLLLVLFISAAAVGLLIHAQLTDKTTISTVYIASVCNCECCTSSNTCIPTHTTAYILEELCTLTSCNKTICHVLEPEKCPLPDAIGRVETECKNDEQTSTATTAGTISSNTFSLRFTSAALIAGLHLKKRFFC
ncbi:unnamed protein product [Didymodactylos carnosus]|uniref:Uncharacterized protein n=1 Tax=Didymodactylos carnosus TaxID=1234261 RepID=A0A815TMC0_9BILA|nr:unnamed protein product [Didymodactylos carnosus]CAF1505809.1 unnamed protein product [Didymodactylos carnosus]CAF4228589.1 unnamed protein product [Didymodactylos carnosus]CAF4367044.1 unnamed protein product [Didymodactylos carnosus]